MRRVRLHGTADGWSSAPLPDNSTTEESNRRSIISGYNRKRRNYIVLDRCATENGIEKERKEKKV